MVNDVIEMSEKALLAKQILTQLYIFTYLCCYMTTYQVSRTNTG
jgi:hypothetical protein